MSKITRKVQECDDFITFEDTWPTEEPVWNRKNWYKELEVSPNAVGGVSVDLSRVASLDRDNYAVDEYIGVSLSKEETKQLITFLQKTIGDDE